MTWRTYNPAAGTAYHSKTRTRAAAKCRPYPLECAEQQALFEWAAWSENKYPDLKWLAAIPNGGYRTPVEAARFKGEGVRAGFPDMILPVARHGYHALAIELKRRKGAGSTVSDGQKAWIAYLTAQGWRAVVCYGADEAIREIENYLRGAG